jgi:hypothetical protein
MLGKSSEVISGEDLKNKMDTFNDKNKNWKPQLSLEEPVGESSVMGSALEAAPGLCGCEECVSNDDQEIVQSPKTINARGMFQGEGQGVHPERESKVAEVEFVTSSVRRLGHRNKALLIREQRQVETEEKKCFQEM